jgi:hypothetical protein
MPTTSRTASPAKLGTSSRTSTPMTAPVSARWRRRFSMQLRKWQSSAGSGERRERRYTHRLRRTRTGLRGSANTTMSGIGRNERSCLRAPFQTNPLASSSFFNKKEREKKGRAVVCCLGRLASAQLRGQGAWGTWGVVVGNEERRASAEHESTHIPTTTTHQLAASSASS